jgi:putative ABC transport system permease protein
MLRIFQRLSRRRKDELLHAELSFHLDQKIHRYIAEGFSQDEARRKASMDLGGLDQIKEECRDARRFHWIDSVVRDMRFTARMLLRNKGFALTVLLTLTLCIGANSAILSMLHALVLKSLPYPEGDRIVEVLNSSTKDSGILPASIVQYFNFKRHTNAFAHLAYFEYEEFTLGGEGKAVRSLGLRARLRH